MRLIPTAALLCAAAASLAAPILAAPPEAASRAIRFADLDLAKPADVARLERRVHLALESVCGSYAGTASSGDEAEAREIARCRADVSAKLKPALAMLIARDGTTRLASAR